MPRTKPRTVAHLVVLIGALSVCGALSGCSVVPQVGAVELTAPPSDIATACSSDFVSVTAVDELSWPAPFAGFTVAPDCFRISTATFDGDASRTDLEVQWLDRTADEYASLADELSEMSAAAGLAQKSDSSDMAYWTSPELAGSDPSGTIYDQGFLAFQDESLVSGRFLEIVHE